MKAESRKRRTFHSWKSPSNLHRVEINALHAPVCCPDQASNSTTLAFLDGFRLLNYWLSLCLNTHLKLIVWYRCICRDRQSIIATFPAIVQRINFAGTVLCGQIESLGVLNLTSLSCADAKRSWETVKVMMFACCLSTSREVGEHGASSSILSGTAKPKPGQFASVQDQKISILPQQVQIYQILRSKLPIWLTCRETWRYVVHPSKSTP